MALTATFEVVLASLVSAKRSLQVTFCVLILEQLVRPFAFFGQSFKEGCIVSATVLMANVKLSIVLILIFIRDL